MNEISDTERERERAAWLLGEEVLRDAADELTKKCSGEKKKQKGSREKKKKKVRS